MPAYKPPTMKQQAPAATESGKIHKVRITLCCRESKPLNKSCVQIVAKSKELGVPTKGPMFCPNKKLRITTRSTPNGQGSKTWDRYQMTLHKRYIDLTCTAEMVMKITSTVTLCPTIDINICMAEE